MPARIAGICGLASFVTVNIGWIAGGLAQPDAYSVARDDISDLGAARSRPGCVVVTPPGHPLGGAPQDATKRKNTGHDPSSLRVSVRWGCGSWLG